MGDKPKATLFSTKESPQQNAGEVVLVVGAGAAGIAAAISAARQGSSVLLVEKTPYVGGIVSRSLIHTLGGLYDSEGKHLNSGLTVELVERLSLASKYTRPRRIGRAWTLNVDPEVYTRVMAGWLDEEQNIRRLNRCRIYRPQMSSHSVKTVDLLIRGKAWILHPRAVIDATGSAEIIRQINPDLVIDEDTAAAGLIFQMHGVTPDTLRFPNNIEVLRALRGAVERGVLPKGCAQAWIDLGIFEDEAYVKLFVPLNDRWREPSVRASATRQAHKTRDRLISFLHNLPAFRDAQLAKTGVLGIRGGGRAVGEYCLTADDVRSARKFDDAIGRCCWPIEYWDRNKGVNLEYLSPGQYYEIPLRALKVQKINNLWVAGKCFSAEYLAQASARVVGCCWVMGEAAGKAAATS